MGDNQPYFIVQNNEIGVGYDALDVIIYDDEDNDFRSNEVRFTWVVPMDIVRSSLFVHSQIKIQLSQNEDTNADNDDNRRLVETEDNVQDQVRHFMHKTQLNAARSLQEEEQQQNDEDDEDGDNRNYSPFVWLDDETMLFIAILFVLTSAIGIILAYARKRRRYAEANERRRNAYINE